MGPLAAALMVVVFLPKTGHVRGQEPSREGAFRARYSEGLNSLKETVGNFHCTVQVVYSGQTPPTSERVVSLGHIWEKGPCKVALYENRREESGRESARAICVTHEFAFQLTRRRPESAFVIDFYGKDRADMKSLEGTFSAYIDRAVWAAFRVGPFTTEELLTNDTLRINGLTDTVTDEGKRSVHMTFEAQIRKRTLFGSVVFCPDLNWAISDYKVTLNFERPGNHHEHSGRVEYMQFEDRVFPKTVRWDQEVWVDGEIEAKEHWDVGVVDVDFGTVSDDEFTLSKFGLPPITLEAEGRSYFPFDHWLFWTLASISLVITILLRQARLLRI